jgi:hypothetical protein
MINEIDYFFGESMGWDQKDPFENIKLIGGTKK